MRPGIPELLIILVIIILVFGAGRIRGVFRELGGGISEFRKGLKEGQDDATTEANKDEPVTGQ